MHQHAKASAAKPLPDIGGRGTPSASQLALVSLATTLLLLACAVPASGAPITFAEFGEGAGQVDDPEGVAVDQSIGHVYIADHNNFRIDKFDSAGSFRMAWGYGVADGHTSTLHTCGPEASLPTTRCFTVDQASGPGAVTPQALAVDQSTGDVYVLDSFFRVEKFSASGQFLLMFGKDVNTTPGTSHPNICTTADLSAGDTCGPGASGIEPGELSAPRSIAVDFAGNIWVGDEGRLQQFNSNGAFASQILLPGAGVTNSLAINSGGDFYLKSEGFAGIRKVEAGTGALIETLDAAGEPRTVTVDGSDNVYVGDQTSPYRFLLFNPAGEQFSQFGAGQVIGGPTDNAIAVGDSAKSLYTASSATADQSAAQIFSLPDPGPLPQGQGAEDVLPTTATLTAMLNPEGHSTTYFFEYGRDDSYGSSTPVAALAGTGFEEEEVEAAIDHLLPATTYHFRLAATNHCDLTEPAEVCTVRGEDTTFTTQPAVRIDAQWATDITANSARFRGDLDPLGVPATWWLEYGLDDSYGSTTPETSLGTGFGSVAVQTDIHNLVPGTTYHYRFAARDEREGVVYTVHGPDQTIVTQLSGLGFELADHRAWEMVSPPNKFGGKLGGIALGLIQAAEDGDGIAYLSLGSTEANPEGNRILEPSTILARRSGEGWRSKDIMPPNTPTVPLAIGALSEFNLFSPDLSRALLERRAGNPLSSQASERTPYLRESGTSALYTPLVTGKEGFANVPPGTEFGGEELSDSTSPVRLAAATPDLSHVALRSEAPLVAGAPKAPLPSLYEWTAGQLHPVSVLPAAEGGALVSAFLVGSGPGSVEHAISSDGTRVFWGPGSGNTSMTALYMRDTEAGETVRIDVAQGTATGTGGARPAFQGASPDGRVVFFTDSQQLTENASPTGRDLYRCEIPLGSAASGCSTLTDLSVPAVGSQESAEVRGRVSALSGDGTAVYFVAEGVLDTVPNQSGKSAVAGQPNLYLWREGQGLRFIATLSSKDAPAWGGALESANTLSAAASPSGRYFSFMSERSLTGYDNRDAASDQPVQEVFRYDALTGHLGCISCNPSGARPLSPPGESKALESLVDPRQTWKGSPLAAVLPEATIAETGGISFYRPRVVLDNGRVFFNAFDALVPADSNGQWDVYQYDPIGLGDCDVSAGGAAIILSSGGCISLITSGTAEEETGFLDASASGDDVFFLTPARLSVTDDDEELDVYDARVDGVPAALAANAECQGEACQPQPFAPNDPTPASSAFNGPGNLRPKAHPKKHCVKSKRRVKRNGRAHCVVRKRDGGKGRTRRAGQSGRAS